MDYLPHGANQRHIGADRLAAADAKRAYTQQPRHYDTQAAIDIGDGLYAAAYFPPVNRVREEADYYQIMEDFSFLAYVAEEEGRLTSGGVEDVTGKIAVWLTNNRSDGN